MSKQKRIIGFIALALAMFMGTLDSTIINIALPDIMKYFKASLNDTSWISTIYVLGLSVFMIPASKLADQFGRKKLMIIGLIIFGLSSALCAMSSSLLFLIIIRFIQGIGGAIITPIVVPMALELFGRKNTQKVAGAVGAVTALAAAGGPPIGGLLIKYINWQSIFYVNVPFALISLFLALFFVGESYDKTVSKSIDWLGMLFLTSTLFLLTFSLLKGKDYGWSSSLIISMFIGSLISLILLIITERKVKAPLIELELFKEATFSASTICYLITGFGIVSPLLIFNYFLQNVLAYEALNAAYIVTAVSLTVIIFMPLGSIIAANRGAKPVNFVGILSMSLGVFMLSLVKVDTPRLVMIIDMIIFGIGLGFSCQSMVSSIKHLPEEKSGIGSGIVNAARQIGTCIGIALLVSVLNSNVSTAKEDIKENAIAEVNKSNIIKPAKEIIIKEINESFKGNSIDQNKLEKNVKNALLSSSETPKPSNNEVLAQLYDGANTLTDGAGKAEDGQKNLNNGINTLSSGLNSLSKGSTGLTDGLTSLDKGLSNALSGAQKLNSSGRDGLNTLSQGIKDLNYGAQKLLSQFSSGGASGNKTIYDGVTGVNSGVQTLSRNLYSYTKAVNSTYFVMIKSDPYASKLLDNYKSALANAEEAYAAASDETVKNQYKEQIEMYNNLVIIYAVGTNPSVTSEDQFEANLLNLASQNNSKNIVAVSNNFISNANTLAYASQKVSNEFTDKGSFKDGAAKIAGGLSRLNENTDKLNGMQNGINSLSSGIAQLKDGSSKLLDGSNKLQTGLTSAVGGSNKLLDGSNKLMDASTKIKDGTSKLTSGISLIGEKSTLQNILSKIEDNKNAEISDAFSKTFLLSSIILLVASIFGIFTDKKEA